MQGVKTSLKKIVAKSKRSRTSHANSAELPAEILLLIGNELLRDPNATLAEIKNLRLVCRAFDRVFASIVLSSIHVFYTSPRGKVLARYHQLRALTTGYDRLFHVEELVLHSWDWIFQSLSRFSTPGSKNPGFKEAVKSKIWNLVLVPAGYVLWALYIDPTTVGRQVRKKMARAQAKRIVQRIEHVSFQLPNVRRVSWWYSKEYPDSCQSVLLNLKVLESLPSLTELELSLDSSYDELEQITVSLSRLRNLQKLIIHVDTSGPKSSQLHLEWLKKMVAHNHDLAYLEVYLNNPYDEPLPDLFHDASPDTPLKLRHLRFAPYFYQITPAMRPHIHCLTSLDVCFPMDGDLHPIDTIWQVLYEEGIHVSEIQTNRITDDMLQYLHHLKKLESLSMYDTPVIGQERNQELAKSLFLALRQHLHTLRRLKMEPYNWGYWYKDPEIRAVLLQCTKLEEFVLHQVPDLVLRVYCHDIVEIARVISQIECSITFILEGEPMLHTWFVQCCRGSPDPMLKDLASRIVYQQSKW